MVDLSSCYFCGAAMDVSLSEHRVVPEALAPTPDEQETVVLCGTCQRKLDRVLTPVVGVAQRHAAERANRAGDDAAGNADAVTQAEPERDDDPDDPERVVPADLVRDAEAGATGSEAAAADDDAEGADGPPFEVDDSTSVFDAADDEAEDDGSDSIFSDGTTTIPDDGRSDHGAGGLGDGITIDDADSAATADGADTAANADDTGTAANADGADTAANADDTGTAANADDAGRRGADPTSPASADRNATGTDDADATPDVDPRTYNKVVRLLKNRDLPVARAEIEAVAGSAYDIPDPECETIIDAAIHRGLVAERDGDLVHPDGD